MKFYLRKYGKIENLPDNYDEIEILTEFFTKKCFEIDVSKLQEGDLEGIIDCAYVNAASKKDSDVINIDFQKNYREKLSQEYDARYESAESIDEKRNVYFNKKFGMSLNMARKMIEDYASDLENIQLTSEQRKFFDEIIKAIDIENEEELDTLYSSFDMGYRPEEVFEIKHSVAKQCAITYVDSFKNTNGRIDVLLEKQDNEAVQDIEFEGKTIKRIKLAGNFDILVHSTDAEFIREREENENVDFPKQWRTGDDKSNHIISMSYINQDFLGCAPVGSKGVMYGFSKLPQDKIKLMGVTDINTYSRNFAYSSKTRKYMSAKTLPYSSRRVYNEFGIEREGTIPDYVILFDDASKEVKKNSYRAASQFEKPVLYIDKKEIEQQQLGNIESMLEEFQKNRDPEILKQILNTYETNVAGWLLNRNGEEDKSHTMSIDNSRFKDDFDQMWKKIENVINQYISIEENSTKTNPNVDELRRVMTILLEERDLYQGSEEVKPISKTKMSYDAVSIIQKVNKSLEQLGGKEYTVNLENIPTATQYKISMQEIVRNALGQAKITSQDVATADIAKGADKTGKKEEEMEQE